MKIAVIGSHGTGKSTLSKALSEKLGYGRIPDIVRDEAVQKGFLINEDTPIETQIWLVARQIELERNTQLPWIADKVLFDYAVYGDIILKDEEVKSVVNRLVERNANYDLIFYLPIEFSLEADGVRSADPEFQKKIDEYYRVYLQKQRIGFFELTGSVEERLNRALSYINSECSSKYMEIMKRMQNYELIKKDLDKMLPEERTKALEKVLDSVLDVVVGGRPSQ